MLTECALYVRPSDERQPMISQDELQKIIMLSHLSFTDSEQIKLRSDMDRIIEFADIVRQAADTAVISDPSDTPENIFRDDTLRESFPADEMLGNASEQDDGFFVIRRCSE